MFKRRRSGKKEARKTTDGAVLDSLAEEHSHVEQASTSGPWDVADAPDDDIKRLDLGSMRVPTPEGIGVQMQTDAKGNISQVVLVAGDSALQLGVFAAPRTAGIWQDVQADISEQIKSQGGSVSEVEGRYGTELLAKVAGKKGASTRVRFLGIDGPRWFVRASFQGKRALDEDAAPQLDECLRNVIVDRGSQAMPVREGLPLKLPPEMAEQAARRIAERKAQGGDSDKAMVATGEPPQQKGRRRPSPRPRSAEG
ncbi:DUF3710 domain-containing protein [Natronoglycomyces albus]|uniref:DUF3710 domain-containing protein n=1 Tax=Natronoglycomyces albus TaxID=2811108 RepID=A0A895XKZ7_9ACTN|nr:DUF3710 domain-containing protein [Natronoglycomyces albus]QSB06391.1 DUF3710 domain-containing protein [Natronoglycomyces albus]